MTLHDFTSFFLTKENFMLVAILLLHARITTLERNVRLLTCLPLKSARRVLPVLFSLLVAAAVIALAGCGTGFGFSTGFNIGTNRLGLTLTNSIGVPSPIR